VTSDALESMNDEIQRLANGRDEKSREIGVSDIQGVKERAAFEHDKVRFLQQSILASLDVKQNQIVKMFTIATAMFLPPTLIAMFYGMNFAVMPELSWEHGFPVSIGMTLVAALSLWYLLTRLVLSCCQLFRRAMPGL
jgi:magnesium transporter